MKLFFSLVFMLIMSFSYAQSIAINNDGRIMVELSDEEKAIKASSSCLKAKEDNRWETIINGTSIMWEVKYIKDSKLYLLYRNATKDYESTTLSGIRSRYSSILLGREVKIQ